MKIGDEVYIHGYVDEIRKDTIIIRNKGGYFGTIPSEVITGELPSAQPELIRCGECKHRYIDGENVRFNACELNHNKVQSDDWYCADAERRTNG